MGFPSIFISNSRWHDKYSDISEIIGFNNLQIVFDKRVKSKVIIIDKQDFLLFAHVNFGYRKKLLEESENIEFLFKDCASIITELHWGFLLFINKKTQSFRLVNDVYGIYPIFYVCHGKEFIISNDLDGLIKLQKSVTLSIHGLYDFFLFNYTLKSRTLLEEIFQMEGGSLAESKSEVLKVTKLKDPGSLILTNMNLSKLDVISDPLISHILSDIDLSLPVKFPLSGGFDSKVILSILLSKNINFSAFTFGTYQSADHIAALSIADQYQFPHEFLEMSNEFVTNIESHLERFMRCSPNAPMFDTLLNYHLVNESIPDSNLVTGQMGGELIVGPVLISELITTRTAAFLTLCSEKERLISGLVKDINGIGFINKNKFQKEAEQYIIPIQDYLKTDQKPRYQNLINFLLNETYAKFFGVVFCNLLPKCNIINPFVDIEFLRILLHSEYSFTNKQPFLKAPISHFMSRRLYPKMINKIYPSVLKSKMDRGYNLEDFLHWYNFPKPFINYFVRHYLTKNSIPPIETGNYLNVLRNLVIEVVGNSKIAELNIFDKKSLRLLIQDLKYNRTTQFQFQKLLQLLTVYCFVNRYESKLNIPI